MSFDIVDKIIWILLSFYSFITLSFPLFHISSFLYSLLVVSLGFVAALIHGSHRYGLKRMVVFLVICLVISNLLENLSIVTGFPFGKYNYTDLLGFKLFAVPAIIGPAYFSTGYLSFVIGNILLDKADKDLSRFNLFMLPLVSSFVMVMWDLVMDPTSSTIQRLWVWQSGGGYFGVPLSNFLGWFLTVYLFFQAFTFYIYKAKISFKDKPTKSYWYQAVLFYLTIAGGFIVNFLTTGGGSMADNRGVIWNVRDIRESAVIVAIYTMFFVSFLAIVRIKSWKSGD